MEESKETQNHISQRFNAELRALHHQVLGMGGLVEEQLSNAIVALTNQDEQLARRVYTSDYKVNALEVLIDDECTRILVRRQPTASDLRLVMSVIKIINDLERIGDESERIARMALQVHSDPKARFFSLIQHLGGHVQQMLHDALDSFARLDVDTALQVIREDRKVNDEYESIVRQLITYMMEDSRTIPTVINILWVARSLERIGDHARNVCEYLIYYVKGQDIRHTSMQNIEEQAKSG